MHQRKQFWSQVRWSLWCLPALVVAGSIGLTAAVIEADPALFAGEERA